MYIFIWMVNIKCIDRCICVYPLGRVCLGKISFLGFFRKLQSELRSYKVLENSEILLFTTYKSLNQIRSYEYIYIFSKHRAHIIYISYIIYHMIYLFSWGKENLVGEKKAKRLQGLTTEELKNIRSSATNVVMVWVNCCVITKKILFQFRRGEELY